MEVITIEDFQNEFDTITDTHITPLLYEHLKDICKKYDLKVDEFACSWIAFSLQKKCHLAVETLDLFEREKLIKGGHVSSRNSVKTPLTCSNKAREKSIYTPSNCTNNNKDYLSSYESSPAMNITPSSTKTIKKRSLESPDSINKKQLVSIDDSLSATPLRAISEKYSGRINAGEIIMEYRASCPNIYWKRSDFSSIPVKINPFNEGWDGDATTSLVSDRYMFRKVFELYNVIQERIEKYKLEILKSNPSLIDNETMETDENLMVRQICLDEGKLTQYTVQVDLDHIHNDHSNNQLSKATLILDSINEFSFFPGQLVAFTGKKCGTDKILINKLYENIFPPIKEVSLTVDALTIVVVSGPFTISDNLEYEPLDDIIAYLTKNTSDVCIMLGPFIDSKQMEIDNLMNEFNVDELFSYLIKKLTSLAENLNMRIVMVPSQRDIQHNCIYPQNSFTTNGSSKTNIYFATDPGTIDIDGIVVGLTSTDIILHLSGQEIASNRHSQDRMSRLITHLLLQRNYYPLDPPSMDINFDLETFHKVGNISVTPHLLLLPSDLKCFIKSINGALCINPGRLVRDCCPGSFARIQFQKLPDNKYTSFSQILRI